ncbi:Sir2 family NAD-dependent protein deacetylase [uncultured Algibacter sp.]|uniref:Sir2 family NAD-dependent protein deacetylase n=1 Tax=uncultured Algibacter sp. TaxID=298659 RepID=UPI0026197FB9|nr:Sir2 family NAD-dependent protein deacetylase [uncultured Algibacter sp.]
MRPVRFLKLDRFGIPISLELLIFINIISCYNFPYVLDQNIDNLHERTGSSHVIHLHGELLKAKSSINEMDVFSCKTDILLNDVYKKGYQLRPHIVWFGEDTPYI